MRRIILAVSMVGGLVAGVTPAGATPVPCGTTITTSTTLTADMTCAGDALVIGGPGVTLDLGGHLLTGGGGGFEAGGAGVRVAAARATIKNGRIQAFRYGALLLAGSDGARVERLSLHRNGDGVHVLSSSNRVTQNSLTFNNSVGLYVSGVGNLIEQNSLQQNSAGVFMTAPNDILSNDIAGEDGDDRGILAFFGGRIVGNRVSHYGGQAGIVLLNGGEVSGNQVFANVDGIRVQGPATVTGNVVFSNADDGIEAGPGAIVGGNIALGNADLGIDAAGATDAGGNRAFANGNPLQCAGVVCRG